MCIISLVLQTILWGRYHNHLHFIYEVLSLSVLENHRKVLDRIRDIQEIQTLNTEKYPNSRLR